MISSFSLHVQINIYILFCLSKRHLVVRAHKTNQADTPSVFGYVNRCSLTLGGRICSTAANESVIAPIFRVIVLICEVENPLLMCPEPPEP